MNPPLPPEDAPDASERDDQPGSHASVVVVPDDVGTLPVRTPLRVPVGVAAPPKPPEYVLQLSVIFNDPRMYALRIALAGNAAKIFKGLDFQIMYRRVTDTVGVYQAEIRLPDAMRELSVGAYSITLPVFGIAVYTNGDFMVDVGFPWNQDFSRSFTIQAIVYPGIPLIGSAGFYFGKLSSASSTRVPVVSDGTFNPVLVFGIGLQVGVGKWIEKGILRAGFSITVVGIVEGVLARFNPYSNLPSAEPANQLQGAYYFWLQGTVGIIGRLFGSIDFAVVKASVDVTVKLLAQITYESYADIAFTVIASVDVSVSIEIDLGLFSISIDFSFRARIKESFVIRNPGTPPWTVAPGGRRTLAARQAPRLRASSLNADAAANAFRALAGLQWENLQALPDADKLRLQGWLAPALTAAADPGSGARAAYVAVFTLASLPGAASTSAAVRAAADAGDTSFETLCKQVFRWVVAAATGPATPAQVDALIVSDDTLAAVLDLLAAMEAPIAPDDANRFMDGQFHVAVTVPSGAGRADATLFPMVPALELDVPAYNGTPERKYTFAGFNQLPPAYLAFLREHFARLATQVAPPPPARKRAAPATAGGPSMASYVFGDYFTLLARQMVQNARDALRSLQVPVSATQSPDDVVRWVNENGAVREVVDGVPGTAPFTRAALFEANPAHPLAEGKVLTVPGVAWAVRPGDTLDRVAAAFGGAFGAAGLAERNAVAANLLDAGAVVRVPGRPDRTVTSGDTFRLLADEAGLSVAQLVDQAGLAAQAGLLVPFAVMSIPPLAHAVAGGDTLGSVAQRYAVTVDDLAEPGANGAVAGLFAAPAGSPFLSVPHLAQFRVAELLREVQRTLGLRQLAGMASRYMLAGLRLPTQGIVQAGPCACGGGTTLPPECGLYALTGQQFVVPELKDGEPFAFTLRKTAGPAWLWMDGSATATELKVTAGPDEVARVRAVQQAAAAGVKPATRTLGVQPMYAVGPASWALSPVTPWQSAGRVDFPYGTPPERESLRLWTFPAQLTDLPDPAVRAERPRFALKVAQYDESTGSMVSRAAGSYAWATRVGIPVKRVPPVPGSPSTAFTYEVMGAGQGDTILLERLLAALPQGDQATVDDLLLLYPSDSATGGTGLESAGAAGLSFFLSQVNLSTETRPEGGVALNAALARSAPRQRACWNAPRDFVRLLWEASVTRAGGFYLYYHDEAAGAGLPERIFNDRGEAVLTLVVTYARPDTGAGRNRLANYMNCAATADGLDPARESVFAEADPEGAERSLATGETPAVLARRYYMDALQLLEDNAGRALAANASVRIEAAVYEVRPTAPGNRLDDIAPYFGVDAAKVRELNPTIQDWNAVPLFTAVRLPGKDAAVAAGSGDSLGSLAAFYGARLGDLATANQDRPGLYTALLWVRGGPTARSATVPPGTVALQATRTIPAVPARPEPGNGWGERYLEKLYGQLGWRVWGEAARGTDFEASGVGLPAGPADAVDGSASRVGLPAPKAAGGTWSYQQAVPAYRYVRDGLPPGAERSPYAAVGRILQVDFAWQDVYGNRVLTPLEDPRLDPASPLNRPPLIVGYTDALVSLSQWPSVASAWHVEGPAASAAVAVELQFDPTRYDGEQGPGNAEQDLRIYDRLLPQLAAASPAPVSFALESTLRAAGPVPLDAAAARGWVEGIRAFLAARAGGGTAGVAPAPLVFRAGLAGGALNPAQLFAIVVEVVMERPRALADADFRDTTGSWRAPTAVPPRVRKQGDEGGYTLAELAVEFEAALATAEWEMKLAAGIDRARVAAPGRGAPLWAVRLGRMDGVGIRYQVVDPGLPVIYAPRPLSNQLRSKDQVPIWDYTTGTPIDFHAEPSRRLAFAGVDLDTWLRQFVGSVDEVLSPEFTSPLGILGHRDGRDYLKALLDEKEKLAGSIAGLLIPVLEDADPDDVSQAEAREVFRQQLLVRLGAAYATTAVVQFRAAVTADIPQPPGSETPRLFGQPAGRGDEELPTGVSVTAARLALRTTTGADPARLTFAVAAGGGTGGPDEQAADRVLPLSLRYRATHLEQEIAPVPGIDGGYRASSWLAFVLPAAPSLEADLGSFDVPLVLRAFPTPPSTTAQQGARTGIPPADETARLEDVVFWDYDFTYREDFHYLQDQTHLRVLFNVAQPGLKAMAVRRDLFDVLAQFATVAPRVEADLHTWLARIDASTGDEEVFRNAAAALESFTEMVGHVAEAWSGGAAPNAMWMGSGPVAERRFVVEEGRRAVNGVDRLLVTLAEPISPVAVAGAGLDVTPVVRIDGWEAVRVDEIVDAWAYEYRKPGTQEWLESLPGRAIPDRTVVLPGLDVLAMQDAWASAWIVRNRDLVPGRPTRDEFVYTTSEIRFASPLHPTLDVPEAIRIDRVGSDRPVERSLAEHLAALLQTLFASDAQSRQVLQLECRYAYPVREGIEAVSLPVLMLPPTGFEVATQFPIPPGGCPAGDTASLPCNLAAAVATWFESYRPVAEGGELRFDLTVMSALTARPMPMLRLRSLVLPLASVKPPLP